MYLVVIRMAMQAINQVREAELKASEAQDSAALKAQQIIDEAKRAAEQIVKEAKENAARREKAAADEAKAKADAIVMSRRKGAEMDAAALREKTMNLRQNIINKLIEETLV